MPNAYLEIERVAYSALASYANVHRGSGHHGLASTQLYDRAKSIVLDCLGLDGKKYVVVFCSPRRAARLTNELALGTYQMVSSQELGLPFGLRAVAVRRRALPRGIPFEAGGGTARLSAADWVLWESGAGRFEAGTPAIVNAIAFARALQILRKGLHCNFPSTTSSASSDEEALDGLAGRELLDHLRGTLIGGKAQVPTAAGARPYVNLDNAASTPTFEAVWDAARLAWRLPPAQRPAQVHKTRAICAEFVGAPAATYDVLFTSNTTEAINLVAGRLGKADRTTCDPIVLTTYLEHNSNELPWRSVEGHGVARLGVDAEGTLDLAELEAQLRAYNREQAHGRLRITLVAVTGASNVLGVFPPLPDIVRLAHGYGAKVLVDAAQLVAHRRVQMDAWGIDYLAFSGHKVYAPFGTGVLVARKGLLAFSPTELDALRASGEENIGGIAALGVALRLVTRIGFDVLAEEEQALLRRTLAGLARLPQVRVHGTRDPESPRLAEKSGIVIFDVKGMLPGRVARELAERAGVGVRSGCHCAHLLIKRLLKIPRWAERLQFLMLILAPGMSLPGVVRVSVGLQTTRQDVDMFLDALADIVQRSPRKPFAREMQAFVDVASRDVFAPLSGMSSRP
jgi:selenocysteine lyase/cysteine desulfurase